MSDSLASWGAARWVTLTTGVIGFQTLTASSRMLKHVTVVLLLATFGINLRYYF